MLKMAKRVMDLFILEFRYRYDKKIYFLIELLAELFGLWVLYLSSKTLIPKIEYFQNFTLSYFDFVFIAEISLRLPSILTQSSIQAIKFAKNNRLLLFIVNSPGSIQLFLLDYMIAKSTKELIKILLLFLIAYLGFNFEINKLFLLNLALLQFLFIPFFVFISLTSAFIFLNLGRGEHLLMKSFSVMAVLSGLYFPITVFPKYIENLLKNVSPLEIILNASRYAYEGRLIVGLKLILYFCSGIILSFLLYKKIQKYPKIKIHEFDYKL